MALERYRIAGLFLKSQTPFPVAPHFIASRSWGLPNQRHGDRERQLRFGRFAPFVESVCGNQAAAFDECLPERGRFIDGLSSGVNGNLGVLSPNRRYSVNGITGDIPSSGIFRVVGGGLALGLCFIEKSSEY
jgi:hypothetical protein